MNKQKKRKKIKGEETDSGEDKEQKPKPKACSKGGKNLFSTAASKQRKEEKDKIRLEEIEAAEQLVREEQEA